jgi:hypothetical protein
LVVAWAKPDWPAPQRVRALYTQRHGAGVSLPPFDHFNLGARCGDDAAAVAANRQLLFQGAKLPQPPRWLNQVHGTTVHRFDATVIEGEVEADAAVTSTPNCVLAVLTADCLPLLLCAEDGSEVAAVHAGWRGLCAGVIEASIVAMRASPARILVWLGPAAGPQAYEVGEEVRSAFLTRDAHAAQAFRSTRPGHWRCDLYALARQRLGALGVVQTFGGDSCTISDPQRYFSHRRDARTGRMASLIWMGDE